MSNKCHFAKLWSKNLKERDMLAEIAFNIISLEYVVEAATRRFTIDNYIV